MEFSAFLRLKKNIEIIKVSTSLKVIDFFFKYEMQYQFILFQNTVEPTH